MAVPKKKTSRSRGRMRRAHWKCPAPASTKCSHCKALIVPHQVCVYCGWYNGKEVISVANA